VKNSHAAVALCLPALCLPALCLPAPCLAVALCFAAGCGAAEPAPPPAPLPPIAKRANAATRSPAPTSDADPFGTPVGAKRFGWVRSERFGLSIPLPDPNAWVVAAGGSFLRLDHPASQSRLWVRIWRDSDRMDHKSCERSARLSIDLPSGGDVFEHAPVPVLAEFDTHAGLSVRRSAADAPVEGALVAFGGRLRECFGYVFTTAAVGADAERVVGERLAIIRGRSLERLERSRVMPEVGRGR
jgi:hypothetical protein